jgi:hypothetical protein
MTSDPASPVELLHGVSLAEYAGISTALAEGISLEPVLQQEGIPHEAWADALGIGPAGVVAFNPGGAAYGKQDLGKYTHVGSVLRMSGKRIQFIDTGVLVGGGGGGYEGGTTDHAFIDGVLPGAMHAVAAGVLKPSPSAPDAAAAAMMGGRPLAYVRLVIADTTTPSPPKVRLITKLLHARVAISTLIWTMRGLPTDALTLFWFVMIPSHAAGTGALLSGGLDQKPQAQLATTSGPRSSPVLLTHVLRGDPSTGGVTVFRRKKEKGKDVWVQNFLSDEKSTIEEMGLDFPLALSASTKLGDFCIDAGTFGLRYTCGAGPSDKGSTDDQAMKATASDPSFFDP